MDAMTVFGTLEDGREVRSVVLRSGAVEAEIVTFGARLHRWQIGGGPNITGKIATLEDYAGRMIYFGAIVAPVINRLRDARAAFQGQVLQLEPNQGGRHCLHSGSIGTHARIWDITAQSDDMVELSVTLADGEGGFPGNRQIGVRYELDEGALRCIISATTDAPTLMNPAQHGNFELSGTGVRAGQRLQVNTDRFLPIDKDV
ncbi:MAG: galactose mutarotase, partial [Alphaproteobacteria bacterium]|nr:galactose mutarotase [Alphaproteobacteria bacterium]